MISQRRSTDETMQMANGGLDHLWQKVNELGARVAVLEDRWSDLRDRRTQIPTWIWLAVTVLMTVLIWLADRVVGYGQP